MTARVLHLLPRCSGGGPERSLLAAIAFAPAAAGLHHVVAVLDRRVAPSMYVAARRAGASMMVAPDDDALRTAARDADAVMVHYWNHPHLLALLARVELPPTRVVVWSHVLGLHRPQVVTSALGAYADLLVLTSDASATAPGVGTARSVCTVPGIADMRRLEGFEPRPHDGIEVGYVGVVNDAKMHPRLVEMAAMVRHPDARFVVHGGGGGEAALRDQAARAGITARFAVAGFTEDVRTALSTIDVFGYPLCADTYATSEKALQEAMWVGVPPVVLPHGGVADLVEHEHTGLVAANEEDWAAAVDRLAADEVLRRRLGEQALQACRSRFDPATLAAAWVACVEAALGQPPRPRPRLYADGTGTGAALFVAALGERAGPFAVASGLADGDVAAAEEEIGRATPVVTGGEGGIVHYRNTWPDDPVLRRWSGLVAAAAGRRDLADSELRAGARLGRVGP